MSCGKNLDNVIQSGKALPYTDKVIVETKHAGKFKSVINEPKILYRYPS